MLIVVRLSVRDDFILIYFDIFLFALVVLCGPFADVLLELCFVVVILLFYFCWFLRLFLSFFSLLEAKLKFQI